MPILESGKFGDVEMKLSLNIGYSPNKAYSPLAEPTARVVQL